MLTWGRNVRVHWKDDSVHLAPFVLLTETSQPLLTSQIELLRGSDTIHLGPLAWHTRLCCFMMLIQLILIGEQ